MKIKLFIIGVLMTACSKTDPNLTVTTRSSDTARSTEKEKAEQNTVLNCNKTIVDLLKTKDYEKLSLYIHPEKGIRFSMYSFVSEQDKSFSKADFAKNVASGQSFTFGQKDGSGAVYTVTLKDYLEEWVFKKDFGNAKVNFETFEGKGNSINNIKKKYQNSVTIENYIPGTVEYSYMDWNSLILIFEKINDKYYLVGIANNQWTV